MGDNDINEDLDGKERPFYVLALISILKVIFLIYDVIVFVPFKIFADPSEKLTMSQRLKARPIGNDDPRSAWRHVSTINGELAISTFDCCRTIADQWNEAVRKFQRSDCFGTREVLSISKEKKTSGKIFEKVILISKPAQNFVHRWSKGKKSITKDHVRRTEELQWEMGEYHWKSFEEVDKRTNLVASGLSSLGLDKNDKVVLFAETREEWMTTAIGCFKSCFPVVTVYATLGEEAVEFAVKEVSAKVVITSENLLPKVEEAIKHGLDIYTVIYFESPDPDSAVHYTSEEAHVLSFSQLLKMGKPDPVNTKCLPEDLAVIMYTSGTTGNPKGVMITHENIVAAVAGQGDAIPIRHHDTYIGYLPLAHILEVCAELVTLTKGVRIGYSSAQTLFDRAPKIKKGCRGDCYALKPTLMACVPVSFAKCFRVCLFYVLTIQNCTYSARTFSSEASIEDPIMQARKIRACYERKRARYEEGYSSFILNRLVFNRIGKLLGGHIRCVLSGGAPLSPETQRFMNICFCCPVVQGYGLTETCGGGTLADVHDLSTGTVGPPLTCCEILLEEWAEAGYSPDNGAPQGEILIGGKNVALGYFKNEEKTKEDFVYRNNKRYFATGDVGEFRADGSLRIIDRKKDLLKLSHGEYISLAKVETNIQTYHGVDMVCIYADSTKDYLVALIVPEHKFLKKLGEEVGIRSDNVEELCREKKVVDAVLKQIQSYLSGKLQRVEIPKKIYLCAEQWTSASGMVTEALKLKRMTIEKAFRKQIDEMCS
ncbi:AMP-binding enzyme [Necator americanus]|uniref:long-chain-fatty-acid--CoA ligase n=1 Tax=Necator americanus TaxID=51031 RepID=W2TG31_NECAM|nr:AMP-binding enzyme [Necator americanus]ETN80559.1 AMP-binding enzyme [Necator americanus]